MHGGVWELVCGFPGRWQCPPSPPDHCPVARPVWHHRESRGDKAFFGDNKIKRNEASVAVEREHLLGEFI